MSPIITEINGYELGREVEVYGPDDMWEFDEDSYKWAEAQGIGRTYRTERYYWLERKTFLGVEFTDCIAATVKGRIYKVFYGCRVEDEAERARVRTMEYLQAQMGAPKVTEVKDGVAFHKWESEDGQVMLGDYPIAINIILTSSIIRRMWTHLTFSVWLNTFNYWMQWVVIVLMALMLLVAVIATVTLREYWATCIFMIIIFAFFYTSFFQSSGGR